MNIQIKTRGIDLTPAIEDYVTKKFTALQKFLKDAPDDLHCLVEVGKTTKHHKHGDVFKADANMSYAGQTLYASSEKEDLYAAIDDLKDELAAELTKNKEKKAAKMRKGKAEVKDMIRGIK